MNGNFDKEIKEIFLDDIVPNRFQPRLNFDQKSLMELSDSIKQHGIIQPLVLRKLGDKYEIIAGERRFKAAQIAGLNTVPSIIVDLDDNKSAEVAIVENLQRKEMSAFEEARSFKKLLEKGVTQDQLAVRLGKSQPYIANKLRLLSLDEKVQDALIKEKISERHARSLLSIKDPIEQQNTLDEIINRKLTVKETDDMIRERFGGVAMIEETNQIHEVPSQLINNTTNIMDFNLEDIPKENNTVQEIIQTNQPIVTPQPVIVPAVEVPQQVIPLSVVEPIVEVPQQIMSQAVVVPIVEVPQQVMPQAVVVPIVEVPQQIMPQAVVEPIVEVPQNMAPVEIVQPVATPMQVVSNIPIGTPVVPVQEINTPKPFILIDEFKSNSDNSLNNKPEARNGFDINPQTSLINRLSSVENNSEAISFKETGNTKASPYVIPRRDIEDTYLTPKSNLDVNTIKNNARNINENPNRSFDIDKLLNSDTKVEEVEKQDYIQPLEREQPQNRFITNVETTAPTEKNDDISRAKNTLKTTVQSVKNTGVKIDFEEFDFERLYQIIIKIEK